MGLEGLGGFPAPSGLHAPSLRGTHRGPCHQWIPQHTRAAQAKGPERQGNWGLRQTEGVGSSGSPSGTAVYQSGFGGWGLGGSQGSGGPMVMLLLVTLGPYQPAQ